jgi:hypothetical protein
MPAISSPSSPATRRTTFTNVLLICLLGAALIDSALCCHWYVPCPVHHVFFMG